jgi:hypothetical protein
MKVVSIKNIIRKDVPIYYKRHFSGVAVLELVKEPVERRIDFSIEHMPTGTKEIVITFVDAVDYPLVPLQRELKLFINNLDANGGLPD